MLLFQTWNDIADEKGLIEPITTFSANQSEMMRLNEVLDRLNDILGPVLCKTKRLIQTTTVMYSKAMDLKTISCSKNRKANLLSTLPTLSSNTVSKACKVMGVLRDTFYRYQELVEEGGIDALINKSRRSLNLKN